jgi:hypothetical protein
MARHVVKAKRRVVRRQEQRRINVQPQQIANRVCVLGAVQAVQHWPAGIRRSRRDAIELAFEPARKRVENCRRRTRRTWGRHQPGTELPRHLLPRFDVGGRGRERGRVERQPAGLQPLVMAGDAVLTQKPLMLRDG